MYNLKPLTASMLLDPGINTAGREQTNLKKCSYNCSTNVEYVCNCDNSNEKLMLFDIANSCSKMKKHLYLKEIN